MTSGKFMFGTAVWGWIHEKTSRGISPAIFSVVSQEMSSSQQFGDFLK